MYDLPSRTDVEGVVIDRDVVAEKVNPTLVPARRVDGPSREVGLTSSPISVTSVRTGSSHDIGGNYAGAVDGVVMSFPVHRSPGRCAGSGAFAAWSVA